MVQLVLAPSKGRRSVEESFSVTTTWFSLSLFFCFLLFLSPYRRTSWFFGARYGSVTVLGFAGAKKETKILLYVFLVLDYFLFSLSFSHLFFLCFFFFVGWFLPLFHWTLSWKSFFNDVLCSTTSWKDLIIISSRLKKEEEEEEEIVEEEGDGKSGRSLETLVGSLSFV